MVMQTEEPDLINQYLITHDPDLRENLILRYVPLIHYVLGRLGISREIGADYEDLVSQGLLGLMEALDRFDPSFGTQFSTYATVRVRGKIQDYLRSLDWLSRTARHRSRVVQKAISDLWEQSQQSPTNEQISNYLNMDVPKIEQALEDASRVIVSLDTILDVGMEESASQHELLADDQQDNPADVVDETDLRQRLVVALKSLSEREQMVLSLYYFDELTFKEIGAVLGVSESRVCQLHGRAVLTLKVQLEIEDPQMESATRQPQQKQRKKAPMAAEDSIPLDLQRETFQRVQISR